MASTPAIRIATRGSAQALAQSQDVADRLAALGAQAELVTIETLGDRTQSANVPLHSIGGQGVFVKEVQRAVLDGRADVAVHSAKDLPSETPGELVLAAFLPRRSVADGLVGATLAELAHGATVATGSIRRRAQLARRRPDLEFAELRGNIHTRLDKVPDGGAIVIAVAALEVLGLTDRLDERLDVDDFVPAVGQGCVAVERRATDSATGELLAALDDAAARHDVSVERAYLAELGAGCSLPVGALADAGSLRAFLADPELGISLTDVVDLDGDPAADVATARRVAAAMQAALARTR